MIKKMKTSDEDVMKLTEYFNEVDNDFVVPLSKKIDLFEFSSKLLHNGIVLASYNGGCIEAIIGFYCNDTQNHTAYLPILSTKQESRGKGIARDLVQRMIFICKDKRMDKVIVDSVNPIAIKLYKSLGFKTEKTMIFDNVTKEFLFLVVQ